LFRPSFLIRGGALVALLVLLAHTVGSDLLRRRLDPAGLTGRVAPPFELEPLTGGSPVALEALRGRAVVLSFFATYCRACKREIPSLIRLTERFPDEDLKVLLIADDSREALAAYIAEAALELPVLLDDGEVHRDYRVRGLPRMVMIGRDGVVRADYEGKPSAAEMARMIASLRD